QVTKVVCDQPEIDWHQDRTDLRHRVEGLQLRVRVRRDVSDAIALRDAKLLKRAGPSVASIEKLAIRPALIAVDDAFAVGVELSRAPHELQRSERDFHGRRF